MRSFLTNTNYPPDPQVRSELANNRGQFSRTKPVALREYAAILYLGVIIAMVLAQVRQTLEPGSAPDSDPLRYLISGRETAVVSR